MATLPGGPPIRDRTKAYRQLPITSFSDTDNIGDVNAILRDLEFGMFRRAALLWDAMYRDDRIRGVVDTRVGALKAVPRMVKPATKKRIARRLAEQLGGIDDSPGDWDRVVPDAVLGELASWGFGIGIAVAEQVYDTDVDVWRPRLRLWHPQWLRWDYSTASYRLLTAEGEVQLPRLDENPSGDGRWFLWCPFGYQYAWTRGLIRALAPKYVMRGWDYRDWARYNELHGQGIVKAIVPGEGGNDEEAEEFFQAVADRGSEPTIEVRQGSEGNKYDVDLVEAKGQTWDSFEHFKQALDVDIAVAVLGQNLTTESPSGGSSSKSLGQVQEKIQRDRLRVDAGIGVAIREQVLMPAAALNVGDPEQAPRPVFQTDPEKDRVQENTALKMFGDALTSLKAASERIDIDTIIEEQGLPMLTDEELAAQKAVKAEEDAARAALNPPPAPGAPPQPGAPPAPGRPPGKAALRGAAPLGLVVSRRTFAGLDVAIENPAGSVRLWKDEDAKTIGSTKMLFDYGFLEGVEGSDGDELDVYLGPDEAATDVHVVHQLAAPDFKRHDEDKTMLGFSDAGAAKTAYLAHRNDGERAWGGMSVMPLDAFKRKLRARTGTGKIRATAAPDALAAIRAMLLAGEKHATTLSRPARRRYTDQLTEKAVRLASRSLAADVSALKVEIGKATDLPSLLKRIVAVYRDKLDPKDLARVVEKTRLMAQLAGQASVHKEARA